MGTKAKGPVCFDLLVDDDDAFMLVPPNSN